MATPSRKNFLNYTGMTHEEIETQVTNKLRADPKFETFLESSIAQTLIEIFTGSTDITNYYLERRAEENYLDTAKLKSSVILLAKQLGYIVTRPIPARTALSMRLYGNLSESGITVGTTIPFNKFSTTFTHNGLEYIMLNSLEYTITQEDIDLGASLSKNISYAYTTSGVLVPDTLPTSEVEDISLYQGIIEQKTIKGSTNNKISQLFQIYKIDDPKFSNLFGTEDVSYDAGDATFDLVNNLTKVGIANDPDLIFSVSADADNLFEIDRRSLINQESLGNYGDAKKLCCIRTHMDGTCELLFGDNNFAQIGPKTVDDNIYIQYFATEGKNANKIGVIGDILNINQDILTGGTSPGITINSHLEFTLKRNISGGANLEDIDSIRFNSPGIFASLDRIVTKSDYIVFLKTLTSPLNVKNSISWGEQEEVRSQNVKAIFKLFNVALYSVLGEIYNVNANGSSEIKPLSGTNSLQDGGILEGDEYNPIDITHFYGYYNILVKQQLPSEIGRIEILAEDHPVKQIYNKLNSKSMVTINNTYITPIIQDFEAHGTVYVNKLSDKLSVTNKANNLVYESLNNQADFHIPLYKSNIIEIVESVTEVKYMNLEFKPTELDYEGLGPLDEEPAIISSSVSADIISIIDTRIGDYMTSAGFASKNATDLNVNTTVTTTLPEDPWFKFGVDWILESDSYQRVNNISERSFLINLVKPIYDDMVTSNALILYRDSDDFSEIIKKMHNSLNFIIRSSMLDVNGNIINYSLRNEIARIDMSKLAYVYIK